MFSLLSSAVYSSEVVKKKQFNEIDYQIVPGFRVRIIPVLGTIPAIFGQVMASYVVTRLAEVQVNMEPVVNFDMDHYRVLHQRLIEHEELQYGTAKQVQVLSSAFSLPKYSTSSLAGTDRFLKFDFVTVFFDRSMILYTIIPEIRSSVP